MEIQADAFFISASEGLNFGITVYLKTRGIMSRKKYFSVNSNQIVSGVIYLDDAKIIARKTLSEMS